jgi:hypothetical protein
MPNFDGLPVEVRWSRRRSSVCSMFSRAYGYWVGSPPDNAAIGISFG